VIPKVVLSSKTLSTLGTGEGALVRMSSLMDHHIVTLGELSMAELADEPLLRTGAPVPLVTKIQSWVV